MLFFTVFIFYLLIANQLVSHSLPMRFSRYDNDIARLNGKTLERAIVSLEAYNHRLSIEGWALCESNAVNSTGEKSIGIFLVSKENVFFCISNELQEMEDVSEYYRKQGMNIANNLHRFDWEISTAELKNDIYDIYIYCEENDKDFGLWDTEYQLSCMAGGELKLAKRPVIVDGTFVETDIDVSILEQKKVERAIASCENIESDTIRVQGWALCESEASEQNKKIGLYLIGEEETYTYIGTQLEERSEITQWYIDRIPEMQIAGDLHGFDWTLSIENIPEGKYCLYIYCEETQQDYGFSDSGYILEKVSDGACSIEQISP